MSIDTGFTAKLLQAALGGLVVRQRVIADNIANVDTPNFTPTAVQFEDLLQAAIVRQESSTPAQRAADDAAADGVTLDISPRLVAIDGPRRRDGNGVDVDHEMVTLAETNLTYNALAQLVGGRFQLLRTVVNDGRR
jgi:flagellar basal-body rod protein FlgB